MRIVEYNISLLDKTRGCLSRNEANLEDAKLLVRVFSAWAEIARENLERNNNNQVLWKNSPKEIKILKRNSQWTDISKKL
jgi:hypothetical protein